MGTKTSALDSFGQLVIGFPFPATCLKEVIVGSRAAEDLFQKNLRDLPWTTKRRSSVERRLVKGERIPAV
jgi:hypothetical protein